MHHNLGGNKQRGFTLIEIITVVAVIGILAAVVTVSVGGRAEREFRNQVQSIYLKLQSASDEAQFSGNEYGVGFEEKSYKFFKFDNQTLKWVNVEEGQFRPADLEADLDIKVVVDENRIDTSVLYPAQVQEKARKFGEKKVTEPQIIFFSDGQMTPFVIQITSKIVKKPKYVIVGEDNFPLELSTRED